jgi:REP element-mobilizing transposase RayT
MRRRRLLAPQDQPTGVYHCLSRVVDRQFILGPPEKELFRSLMLELAEFCQVRILTYCIMSNHFHLLVEVPSPPAVLPPAEEALEALSKLSGCQDISAARDQLEVIRTSGNPEAEREWAARIHARRWNLSNFLKLLKQRFSAAYNRKMRRKGTLWEERFRSVLVEGEGHGLATIAAYIDLNPVRAGIVQDPKEYRWCGYGEAASGEDRAVKGLQRVMQGHPGAEAQADRNPLAAYSCHLYSRGSEDRETTGPDGKSLRAAIPRERVLEILANRGRLPMAEYLRCRVRYFCDGSVLGSREYVERIFQAERHRFGPRRKTGARAIRGLAGADLYTARALRLNVFG